MVRVLNVWFCLNYFTCAVWQRLVFHLIWLGASSCEAAQPSSSTPGTSSPLPWPSCFHQWPQRAEDRPQPHFGAWLSCLWAATLPLAPAEGVQRVRVQRAPSHVFRQPAVNCCEESLPLLCQPVLWGGVCPQPDIYLFLLPWLWSRELLPWIQHGGGTRPAAQHQQQLLRLQHGQLHSHWLGREDAFRSDQSELLIYRSWSSWRGITWLNHFNFSTPSLALLTLMSYCFSQHLDQIKHHHFDIFVKCCTKLCLFFLS